MGLRKIDELEGLRGVMAWWVVVGHVLQTIDIRVFVLSRNTLAVEVFIILSGFVISYLIAARPEPYRRYLLRRGFRLFPLYLLVLLVSIASLGWVAETIAALPFGGAANANRLELTRAGLVEPWPHFVAHLFLAQGVLPESVLADAPFTLVGQAWSISLEWQFYLVAPLIALACSRVPGRAAFVAIAAVLALTPTLVGEAFLVDRIALFAIGIASFWLFRAVHERPEWSIAPMLVAVVAIVMLLATGAIEWLPIAIWATTLASTASFDRRDWFAPLRRLLLHPALLGEGRRSYSIYMVHMLVLWSTAGLLTPWIADRRWLAVTIGAVTLVVTMILSRLTYRWVEVPGIALGGRLAADRAK